MKKTRITAIMILALGLMVLAGSVTKGDVHLEIDGQDVDTITLKQFQQCSITVVSDDNASYELNVQLLSLFGSFTHDRTEAIAGDLATVTKYGTRAFYVTAAGSGIAAGVHFVFSYEPNTPGINRLDLLDRSQMFPEIIDSIDITILPFSGPMGTAWTYQGRLMDANYPADGLYDFEFKLYNCSDPCWGVQLGDTVDVNGHDVIDGHFIVELDFGSDFFDGNAVWLETSVVRSPLGSAPAALRPLIEITPVPYALQTRGIFVDSAGNVGIGTMAMAPAYKLTVDGRIHTYNTVSAEADSTGILGKTSGQYSRAVYGVSTGDSSTAVIGQAHGPHSQGIVGVGMDSIGINYGVRGQTNSSDGYAGYFKGGKNYFEGNVGIGAINPAEKLHIGKPSGHLGLRISSDDSSYQYMNFGATNGYSIGRASDDKLFINRDEPVGTAVSRILTVQPDGNVGIGTANPTEKVEVSGNVKVNGMGNGVIFPDGTKQTTAVSGGDMDWTVSGNNMYSSVSGNIGIGTTSPTTKLDVEGNGTNTPLEVDAKGMSNNARAFRIKNTGMADGTNLNFNIGKADVLGQTGEITYYHAGDANPDNVLSLGLWGPGKILNMTYEGNVGIGTMDPGAKLEVVTSEATGRAVYGEVTANSIDNRAVYGRHTNSGNYGYIGAWRFGVYGSSYYDGSMGVGVYGVCYGENGSGVKGEASTISEGGNGVYGFARSATGYGVKAVNDNVDGTGLYAKGGSNGYAGLFIGKVGIQTDGDPTPKIQLNGNNGWITTQVLEITGGDLVEGFDTGELTSEPGTVMVIDSENPGNLVQSTTAYDRKVAGIVSGAGGIKHGIHMGKQEALDGDTLVALSGRVYVLADASYGAIEPGDLLTTSDTPGHAMKVTDYNKSQGATLGKAMTSLEESKGLVLVLVSLQ